MHAKLKHLRSSIAPTSILTRRSNRQQGTAGRTWSACRQGPSIVPPSGRLIDKVELLALRLFKCFHPNFWGVWGCFLLLLSVWYFWVWDDTDLGTVVYAGWVLWDYDCFAVLDTIEEGSTSIFRWLFHRGSLGITFEKSSELIVVCNHCNRRVDDYPCFGP